MSEDNRMTDGLKGPLYRLLLSANSVDQDLRNEVDGEFRALEAALARQSSGVGEEEIREAVNIAHHLKRCCEQAKSRADLVCSPASTYLDAAALLERLTR
jgi:hypothetical protein